MTRLRVLCAAVVLACASGQVLAATASHNAAAEKFLTLVNADKLGTPVYMQVQQMFAQRFAQTKAPESKKNVLDSYQAKANAALDNAIGWKKIKPKMVDLYTQTFTEQELKEAVAEEIAQSRRLFSQRGWPMIDVTRRSIEETAAAIQGLLRAHRRARIVET